MVPFDPRTRARILCVDVKSFCSKLLFNDPEVVKPVTPAALPAWRIDNLRNEDLEFIVDRCQKLDHVIDLIESLDPDDGAIDPLHQVVHVLAEIAETIRDDVPYYGFHKDLTKVTDRALNQLAEPVGETLHAEESQPVDSNQPSDDLQFESVRRRTRKSKRKSGKEFKNWCFRSKELELAEDWEDFKADCNGRATFLDFVEIRGLNQTPQDIQTRLNTHYRWENRIHDAYVNKPEDLTDRQLAESMIPGMSEDDLKRIVERSRKRKQSRPTRQSRPRIRRS